MKELTNEEAAVAFARTAAFQGKRIAALCTIIKAAARAGTHRDTLMFAVDEIHGIAEDLQECPWEPEEADAGADDGQESA